jgi:hypothetical protein
VEARGLNINIQIERLILEGVSLPRSQRSLLQAAVEAELSRLFSVNGLPPSLQNGGTIPKLPANINVTKTIDPTQMGQQIAQSIYGGLNS